MFVTVTGSSKERGRIPTPVQGRDAAEMVARRLRMKKGTLTGNGTKQLVIRLAGQGVNFKTEKKVENVKATGKIKKRKAKRRTSTTALRTACVSESAALCHRRGNIYVQG